MATTAGDVVAAASAIVHDNDMSDDDDGGGSMAIFDTHYGVSFQLYKNILRYHSTMVLSNNDSIANYLLSKSNRLEMFMFNEAWSSERMHKGFSLKNWYAHINVVKLDTQEIVDFAESVVDAKVPIGSDRYTKLGVCMETFASFVTGDRDWYLYRLPFYTFAEIQAIDEDAKNVAHSLTMSIRSYTRCNNEYIRITSENYLPSLLDAATTQQHSRDTAVTRNTYYIFGDRLGINGPFRSISNNIVYTSFVSDRPASLDRPTVDELPSTNASYTDFERINYDDSNAANMFSAPLQQIYILSDKLVNINNFCGANDGNLAHENELFDVLLDNFWDNKLLQFSPQFPYHLMHAPKSHVKRIHKQTSSLHSIDAFSLSTLITKCCIDRSPLACCCNHCCRCFVYLLQDTTPISDLALSSTLKIFDAKLFEFWFIKKDRVPAHFLWHKIYIHHRHDNNNNNDNNGMYAALSSQHCTQRNERKYVRGKSPICFGRQSEKEAACFFVVMLQECRQVLVYSAVVNRCSEARYDSLVANFPGRKFYHITQEPPDANQRQHLLKTVDVRGMFENIHSNVYHLQTLDTLVITGKSALFPCSTLTPKQARHLLHVASMPNNTININVFQKFVRLGGLYKHKYCKHSMENDKSSTPCNKASDGLVVEAADEDQPPPPSMEPIQKTLHRYKGISMLLLDYGPIEFLLFVNSEKMDVVVQFDVQVLLKDYLEEVNPLYIQEHDIFDNINVLYDLLNRKSPSDFDITW